jgi:hypothetical protein
MSGVVPYFLTNYKQPYRAYAWTAMFDRVSWLTMEEAREFLCRAQFMCYRLVSEDEVRAKLVANELMK